MTMILHEIFAEKQRQLARERSKIDKYIAGFAGQANDPARFHFVSFYEGDEGMASILRDVLKTCRRMSVTKYRVISSPRVSKYLYNNFPHFTRERIKQRLTVIVLRQRSILGDEAELAHARVLSPTTADTDCYTLIYGKKVAIITIDLLNRMNGVIIDNADYATIQKNLFDAMWRNLTSSPGE